MARKTGNSTQVYIAEMPKILAGVRIGHVHLNNRDGDCFNRVEDADRRVGIASGVQQDRLRTHAVRFMQPVNQMAFMV
jgi:hypothetical protein